MMKHNNYKPETMKTTCRIHLVARFLAALIGGIGAMPVLVLSETPPVSADKELGVEVLSLSVSKLERDTFGRAINPFSGFDFTPGDSGTMVFAKITPASSPPVRLMEDKCRLISFKDDAGTDLLATNAVGLGSPVFVGNRALEVLTARDPGLFGLKIRSPRVPASSATRLTADVLLVFSSSSAQRTAQMTDVLLQTNEVVAIGPLKVRFWEWSPTFFHGTNQPTAGSQSPSWSASLLPETDAAVASVVFFSALSDEPILVARNLSLYSPYKRSGDSRESSIGPGSYPFTRPADGKVTIKVRYYDAGTLVEKHCAISTGLSP